MSSRISNRIDGDAAHNKALQLTARQRAFCEAAVFVKNEFAYFVYRFLFFAPLFLDTRSFGRPGLASRQPSVRARVGDASDHRRSIGYESRGTLSQTAYNAKARFVLTDCD